MGPAPGAAAWAWDGAQQQAPDEPISTSPGGEQDRSGAGGLDVLLLGLGTSPVPQQMDLLCNGASAQDPTALSRAPPSPAGVLPLQEGCPGDPT